MDKPYWNTGSIRIDNAVAFAPPTYRIRITESFSVDLYGKTPNKFHKFMMGLVFGWKFEKVGISND